MIEVGLASTFSDVSDGPLIRQWQGLVYLPWSFVVIGFT